jgi:hypothetical protein
MDMQYLCAAAGYADVVVTEKKMCELLTRANTRLPPAADVCRTLPEAAAAVAKRPAASPRNLEAATDSG